MSSMVMDADSLSGRIGSIKRRKVSLKFPHCRTWFSWDINYQGICWEGNTTVHQQSSKFLVCVRGNFLLQMVESPTKEALFNLTERHWLRM